VHGENECAPGQTDEHDIAGDYLYIEPAANDEVEIKDIRVRFRN